MDLPPWLVLRQASEAVAADRPDDAHRLLAPLIEEGHRKAWRLARDVAKGYCRRAAKALDRDTPDAAWRDLLAAEALNTGEKCVADLRLTLTRFGLVQARTALEAGDPRAAAGTAARLRDRGVRHRDLPPVEDAAADWLAAAQKADRGEFLPALDDLHRVRAKLPCPPTGLDQFRAAVAARHERFLDAVGRAQDAAGGRQWRDAVVAAEDALTAAPEYHVARTLHTKALQAGYPEARAAGPDSTAPGPGGSAVPITHLFTATASHPGIPAAPLHAFPDTASVPRLALRGSNNPDPRPDPPGPRPGATRPLRPVPPGEDDAGRASSSGGGLGTDRSPLPKRFLLWVDGVAGFLVCTGTRVTFGQAVLEGGPVDVPLFADVSRVHAELTRDGEGYLVESGKAAPVNGKEVTRTVLVNGKEAARTVLAPGDRVTLGATCQFVFGRPVAVSSTARLELTSGHRLMLPVEGVLLMANEVILGPPPAHVAVPDLPGRVILYRSKDGLGVRYADGKFRVNDQPCLDRAALPLPASFECESLTFSVEAVGPRL
jgi:hypothetical protein